MSTIVRPAVGSDLAFAVKHLMAAGLPTEDLEASHLVSTAESSGEIVGVVGYESFAQTGLLRSLIVSELARGCGAGAQLVDAVEEFAAASGATEIWLLTIDADVWFGRLGYAVRDRQDAPEAIRGTQEFSGLCPGDAVLMSKSL